MRYLFIFFICLSFQNLFAHSPKDSNITKGFSAFKTKNYKGAIVFLEQAIPNNEEPLDNAYYFLGTIYESCICKYENWEKAFDNYKTGTALKKLLCQTRLAMLYMHGYFVPIDETKGLELLANAAKNNFAEALLM